jgi:hypothetical protein
MLAIREADAAADVGYKLLQHPQCAFRPQRIDRALGPTGIAGRGRRVRWRAPPSEVECRPQPRDPTVVTPAARPGQVPEIDLLVAWEEGEMKAVS